MFNLIILISTLLIFGLIIWLQFYLSKSQNKWLGLILPAIAVVISLIVIIGFAAFNTQTESGITTTEIGKSGKTILIQSDKIEMGIDYSKSVLFVMNSLLLFIQLNIPTLILLVIYLVTKKKTRAN